MASLAEKYVLEVQEVYNKVSTPRTISAIEALGLKSCRA